MLSYDEEFIKSVTIQTDVVIDWPSISLRNTERIEIVGCDVIFFDGVLYVKQREVEG